MCLHIMQNMENKYLKIFAIFIVAISVLFVVKVALADAPTVPSDITAYYLADDLFKITWTDNSADEAGFYLDRNASGAGWVQLANISANTDYYYDDTTEANAYYSYRIRAYNAGAEESSNDTLSSIVNTTPLGIYNLSIDYTSGSGNELTWEENAVVEISIEIYADDVFVASLAANSTTYTHDAGTAETDYQVFTVVGGLSSTITEEGSSLWIYEHVEPSGLTFAQTETVIDSSGNTHIAFVDGNGRTEKSNLMYGFKENGETSWHYSRVGNDGSNTSQTLFLEVDSNDIPHILATSALNNGLTKHYTWSTTGTWQSYDIIDINNFEGVGEFGDVVMDSTGTFHLAVFHENTDYEDYDNSEYEILYYTYDGAGTLSSAETVHLYSGVEIWNLSEIKIMIDSANSPRITFSFQPTSSNAYNLAYTNKDSGSWSVPSNVKSMSDTLYGFSIEYDTTNDCDNIIYGNIHSWGDDSHIYHQAYCDETWSEITIDSTAGFALDDSDIGINGDIVIASHFVAPTDIYYYLLYDKSEATWSTPEAIHTSSSNLGVENVFYNNGAPFIVSVRDTYGENISLHPVFVNRNSGAWDTGDYEAYSGWFVYSRDTGSHSYPTSIAVDANDIPHIIYFKLIEDDSGVNEEDWDEELQLKHAWKISGEWTTEIVDTVDANSISQGDISTDISFECGKGGTYDTTVHVALNEDTTNNITYYAKETDTWAKTTVDANVTAQYRWVDLELDSSCNPNISYTSNSTPYIAVYNGSWVTKQINATPAYNATYIVIDAITGDYHAASSDNSYIYYYYSNDAGNNWSMTNVGNSTKWHPTIDLDSNGNPVISTSGALFVYDSQWTTVEYEDDYSESNRYTSFPLIMVDDTPFVFHVRISSGMGTNTAYAYYTGGAWSDTNYTNLDYVPVRDTIKDGIIYSAIGGREGSDEQPGISYATSSIGMTPPSDCNFSSLTEESLTVNWVDEVLSETAFIVEQSLDNSDWSILSTSIPADSTSYDVSNLDSSTTYYFRIKATDGAEDSAYLACSAVTTRASTPVASTTTSPANSATEVSLNPTFEISSTIADGSDVQYRLELSTDSNFKTTALHFDQRENNIGWSDTIYADSETASFILPATYSLTSNTTYYWRFRAFSASGASAVSTEDWGANYSFTTIVSSEEEVSDVAFVDGATSGSKIDIENSTINFGQEIITLPATNTLSTAAGMTNDGITEGKLEILDYEGDGDLDILAVDSAVMGAFSYVYINDGTASFTVSAYSLDSYSDIIPGDIDGDGDIDLLKFGTGNYIEENEQGGAGTFTADMVTFVDGTFISCDLGDLDNDGDLDLVCATGGGGAGVNAAFKNDGDGAFTAFSTNPFTVSDNSVDIIIEDVNQDGWKDILVANDTEQSFLYLNNQDDTFTKSNAFDDTTDHGTYNMVTADLDNDGDLDVIETGGSWDEIYFNDGTGTFIASTERYSLSGPAEAGDIDGDGDIDFISTSNTVTYLYRNNGLGEFTSTEIYSSAVTDAAIGDFDGDGDQDIMLAINSAENVMLTNNAANDFIESSLAYKVLDIFDYDLDGDQDMVISSINTENLYLQINDGSQNYTASQLPLAPSPSCYADVNGDGYRDLIGPGEEGEVGDAIYINDRDNTFTLQLTPFGVSAHEMNCKTFDADMDGDIDVLFVNDGDDSATELWLNDGSANFSSTSEFDGLDMWGRSIGIADIDLDGDKDIVLNTNDNSEVEIHFNDGNGAFTSSETGINMSNLNLSELTGDKYPDLVLVSNDGVNIFKNINGTFSTNATTIQIDCVSPQFVLSIDLDGDDDNDLIIDCNEDPSQKDIVLINNGDLNFSSSRSWFDQEAVWSHFIKGDYDSDGDMDFFVYNEGEGGGSSTSFSYTNTKTFTTSTNFNVISSQSLDSTDDTIYSATLTATTQTPTGSAVNYYLSAAVSATWADEDYEGSEDLNDILAFEDGDTWVTAVVGDNGEAYIYEDEAWAASSGTDENLNAVTDSFDGDITIAGDNGYFGLFDDGDVLTQICDGSTSENLNALAGNIESTEVFAVGDNGIAFDVDLDDDDPECIIFENMDTSVNFNSSANPEQDTYIAVGEEGTIIFTENGGTSWNIVATGTTVGLNDLADVEDKSIVVGDSGTIFSIGEQAAITTIASGVTTDLYSVTAISEDGDDNDAVFISGAEGVVLYSDDGGLTFSEFSTGSSSDLLGISYDDEGSPYAVGTDNTFIYYSEDPVPTWEGPVTSGEEWTFTETGSSLMWKAVLSTTDENVTPILDIMSVDYATTEAETTDDDTRTCTDCSSPNMPTASTPDIIGPTSIQWNFTDNSTNESGYKLYTGDQVFLSQLDNAQVFYTEEGLTPNTEYTRYLSAINQWGESSKVQLGQVYTHAAVPIISSVVSVGENEALFTMSGNANPNTTQYAIYESTTEKWVQESGVLGDTIYWGVGNTWLPGGQVTLQGLLNNEDYEFLIKAINENNLETNFSSSLSFSMDQVDYANIVLTKKVGINLSEQLAQSGVAFGGVAFAGNGAGVFLQQLPLISSVANIYIVVLAVFLMLFILGVVFNSADHKFLYRAKHLKYIPRILFKDLKRKKGVELYHLIHKRKSQKKYGRHTLFYKYSGVSLLLLLLGVIIKTLVVAVLLIAVYLNVGVQAFDSQTGATVAFGDEITYRIEYLNNGQEDAGLVTITDTLPSQVSYVVGSVSSDCIFSSGMVTCSLGEVISGSSGYVDFVTQVVGEVGDVIINSTSVSFSGGLGEANESNSVSNVIVNPDCQIDICIGETRNVTLGEGWNYFVMAVDSAVLFSHEGETHGVYLEESDLDNLATVITVSSDSFDVGVAEGVIVNVDSDGNSINDLALTVQTVTSNEQATVGIMSLFEEDVILVVCSEGATQSCTAGNGCFGTKTCSSNEWGSCVSSLVKCEDGSCQVNSGSCPFIILPYCGDDLCNDGETCSSCAMDCGACLKTVVCGDNACEGGETCESCQSDCGLCEEEEIPYTRPIEEVCGNFLCEEEESCTSCSEDCGACPIDIVVGEVCGNNVCEGAENCLSCSSDCGECQKDDVDRIKEEVYAQTKAEVKKIDDEILLIEKEIEKSGKQIDRAILTVKKTTKQVEKAVVVVQKVVLDNPIVEKVSEDVTTPTVIAFTAVGISNVAAATATATSSAAGGLGVLAYLQFFTIQPLMLFSRKKREKWGVVYDSISKKPIPLAILRIFNKETGKLVQTKVSDKNGRYQVIVDPGKYYIQITKDEYVYPSEILFGEDQDSKYYGLYHGGTIEATEKMILNFNIPIDPNKSEVAPSKMVKRKMIKSLQNGIAIVGPIAATISLIINPTWWVAILLVFQLMLVIIFRKMAIPAKSKNWGAVLDEKTNKPIKNAVVRVFDTRYNKLLESQVTDNNGRYGFLVTKNDYLVTSEKPKYSKFESATISVSSDQGGLIAQDIDMEHQVDEIKPDQD